MSPYHLLWPCLTPCGLWQDGEEDELVDDDIDAAQFRLLGVSMSSFNSRKDSGIRSRRSSIQAQVSGGGTRYLGTGHRGRTVTRQVQFRVPSCGPGLRSRSRNRSWSRPEWVVLAEVRVGNNLPTQTPVRNHGSCLVSGR